MPRKKQIKLDMVKTLPNVFDYKQEKVEKEIRAFFKNEKPFTLELGCGQADYSINLAKLYPERNFIAIDRKPSRIYNGAVNVLDMKLNNVVFLSGHAEKLETVFSENSVEEIWIPFPDPYPRRSSMKKRLVHPRFIIVYKKFLLKRGIINLKTDDDTLYHYALQVIKENNLILNKCTDNLYSTENISEEEKILTKYERQHLEEGKTIKLASFSL